jgi:predicted enzyme related to lactoylglutathione lyase
MPSSPEVRALNLTVPDIEDVSNFYRGMFPEATVSDGAFFGIGYRALLGQDGEVAVCFFQGGPDTPLAASFPTIMVDSVDSYLSKVPALNGKVLVPPNPCPCTGAPFAICDDGAGNQFMIKQPRARDTH